MKLSNFVVLATTMTIAARRGTPIHVVFNGIIHFDPNTVFDNKARNATFQEKPGKYLKAKCHDELGGGTVKGYLRWDDTFVIHCDCAHGNTALPIKIDEDIWSADGSSTGKC